MSVIEDTVKYVLYSAYLKDEKPVSLLIIAETESGKTAVIDNFCGMDKEKTVENQGIVYVNDITPFGLVQELYRYHQQLHLPVNHIVIPDLLNPLSKNKASRQGLISILNSLTEEGLSRIKTASITYDIPTIQCGLITAITTAGLRKRVKHWKDVGFIRRMLPISYSYSMDTISEVMESIYISDYKSSIIKLKFPKKKKLIELDPKFARMMAPYTNRLANELNCYGFTDQKHFQRLLKAIALYRGKTAVDIRDVNELKRCAKYMNLGLKSI